MRTGLAPSASSVRDLLKRSDGRHDRSHDGATETWVHGLIGRRREFGVTRVGSITRLDRIGIPIVQAVRPLSLSNAVSQGKGLTWRQAAASALMEAIESWAAETIPRERLVSATIESFGAAVRSLYEPWLVNDAQMDCHSRPLTWIEGWDLLADRIMPVPTALVDTIYTLPSPHPIMFPRTTTGLGAGRTFAQAVIHAAMEVLERDAIAQAHRTPHFFDLHQTGLPEKGDGPCGKLLASIRGADLLCALWQAPAAHTLPVYWCHLMERGPPDELVPLPSEGFGCDWTHDGAVAKALLEACQARATAISGAREDLTRLHYPDHHDRAHLAEWREQLYAPWRLRVFPSDSRDVGKSNGNHVAHVLDALREAGARAAVVVPLFSDDEAEIHVVRLVAPPLRLNPRTG